MQRPNPATEPWNHGQEEKSSPVKFDNLPISMDWFKGKFTDFTGTSLCLMGKSICFPVKFPFNQSNDRSQKFVEYDWNIGNNL